MVSESKKKKKKVCKPCGVTPNKFGNFTLISRERRHDKGVGDGKQGKGIREDKGEMPALNV